MRKAYLIRPAFLLACIAGLLSTSFVRGKSMNPQAFFFGDQLTAYRMAQKGDSTGVIEAVRGGVDLNKPGHDRMTMLGLAVLTAERQAIITLMRAGANPNQVIPDAGSPAILAITKHFNPPRTEAVAALLDGGYDPNQLLTSGKPYLFFFVDYNHWPGLNLALERGGNVNIQRSSGESLLAYVVEGRDYKQARALIAAGADVGAHGRGTDSPLLAIESHIRKGNPSSGKSWREMVELRELILSKLSDPKDRHTAFTAIVEEKIRQNPK